MNEMIKVPLQHIKVHQSTLEFESSETGWNFKYVGELWHVSFGNMSIFSMHKLQDTTHWRGYTVDELECLTLERVTFVYRKVVFLVSKQLHLRWVSNIQFYCFCWVWPTCNYWHTCILICLKKRLFELTRYNFDWNGKMSKNQWFMF